MTLIVALFLSLCTNRAMAAGAADLFPTDSLDSWYIVGPQISYTLENGILTGEGNETRNAFLTSKKSYGDFILQVDVKIVHGNSGIQIRSHDVDDRLVGYQIEADGSERAWSGGLYDEGRRAWLQPPDEEVRDAFKLGEWNTYKITCIGPRIKATVNGKITTNFLDFMDLRGHIGFQVHSGGCKVQWRNATIVDLDEVHTNMRYSMSTPLSLQPLFDGKTLGGMDSVGGGTWTVEEGAIVGRQSVDDAVTGLLWIAQPYEAFALKLKYKIDKGNSGFFFRAQQIQNDNTGIRGIQVEIDREPDCGGLYETGGRGWVCKPAEKFSNYDQWNDLMVYTCGDQVTVWINNKLVVDCDTSPQLKKTDTGSYTSNFAFQLHARQEVEVRFKEIEIMVPTHVNEQGDSIDLFIGCDYFGDS